VLRLHRLRAGLTQQQLSQRAEVSVRTVRDIERVRAWPRPESARRLAAVVGLDPEDAVRASRRDPPGRRRAGPGGPDAGHLEVGVLGPLRVDRDGQPVEVGSLKQRCMLATLALQPGCVVGSEELIDVLWGEHPPSACRNLVHTYVARLRRLLGPQQASARAPAQMIATANGGYRFMADDTQLDLLRFDQFAARASEMQATDPARALELLTRALGSWRGPVLAGLTERLSQHPVAVAVAGRRLAAAAAYADLALELRQYQQAVAGLRPLSVEEPLHEGLHARLMIALAGCGQQAAALEVFADLRRTLAAELGVEPGTEMQDAQARVLRGEIPPVRAAWHGPAARVTGHPRPAQLPADVRGFTGRVRDLEWLGALLSAAGHPDATTVVISAIGGMAGVGKTALAVHWAHRVASRFGDGQLYIDLRGYSPDPPLDPPSPWRAARLVLVETPRRLHSDAGRRNPRSSATDRYHGLNGYAGPPDGAGSATRMAFVACGSCSGLPLNA